MAAKTTIFAGAVWQKYTPSAATGNACGNGGFWDRKKTLRDVLKL